MPVLRIWGIKELGITKKNHIWQQCASSSCSPLYSFLLRQRLFAKRDSAVAQISRRAPASNQPHNSTPALASNRLRLLPAHAPSKQTDEPFVDIVIFSKKSDCAIMPVLRVWGIKAVGISKKNHTGQQCDSSSCSPLYSFLLRQRLFAKRDSAVAQISRRAPASNQPHNSNNFCPVPCPGYYEPILHVIGVISTILNVFGIYLTMYRSTHKSKYRFCQLYVQLTAFCTEFDLSIINPAYFYFPMIGGINCGMFRHFQVKYEITSHFCITIFAFIFSLQVPSMFCCFLYRHQIAAKCSPSAIMTFNKHTIYLLLAIFHIIPVMLTISLYKSKLTMAEKKESINLNYPDCYHVLQDFTFDMYDPNINANFLIFVFLVSFLILISIISSSFMTWRTANILNMYRAIMSTRTYQMQKASLTALTAQISAPSVIFGIPVASVYSVMAGNSSTFHAFAATAPMFVSMHSMAFTLCLIFTNAQFRRIVFHRFYKHLK
ncbi:unnamed protein product [Caenorhabditis bovis]|uniref:G protein-coupled receptor n=1 Tax=Caenorhabditis bovis TaxID=2654633 RepID=A0A8S1EF09_9PELO|nr:unnamed protein product [Caenorhabditis bovis]